MDIQEPTLIMEEPISQIATGSSFSMVLTSNGELKVFGGSVLSFLFVLSSNQKKTETRTVNFYFQVYVKNTQKLGGKKDK